MARDSVVWLLLLLAALLLCISALQGTTGCVLAALLAPNLLVRSK